MSEKNPFYGSTFAERKAIREGRDLPEADAEGKQVEDSTEKVENKAVGSSESKRPRKSAKS